MQGYLKNRKAHFRTLLVQYISLVGFKILIAAGLLVMGGLLVINQQMNLGQFVASEIVIILVLASIEKLIVSMGTIYDVLTAIEKIGLITDLTLEDDTGRRLGDIHEGLEIKLNNLSYKFKNNTAQVLNNINFILGKGETLCVSGNIGAGKSLLLQMISGLYDSFDGSLVINGQPIGGICKENLRTHIGDNLTKEDIFQGTLFENISLGKNFVSLENVKNVAAIVGLCDFVESLPKGYDTMMQSEAQNLPKSIKLKIILARSIVGHPRLVLLENNYESLPETDRMRFLSHVFSKKEAWTVIAISNEQKVAEMCDKVLLLNKGDMIGFGTFAQIQKFNILK